MPKSKYIGKVYEGRWQVTAITPSKSSASAAKYCLENVFNHSELIISRKQMVKIERGETTVSKIIARKLVKAKNGKRNWNDYY